MTLKPFKVRKCSECKWMIEPGRNASCHAPQNRDRSIYDDQIVGFADDIPRWRYLPCFIHRNDNWLDARMSNSCGREGRWWEPKP